MNSNRVTLHYDCHHVIPTVLSIHLPIPIVSMWSEHLTRSAKTSKKFSYSDLQADMAFDFENALEHIVQWFRHNVRAAQQELKKDKHHFQNGSWRNLLYLRLVSKDSTTKISWVPSLLGHSFGKRIDVCFHKYYDNCHIICKRIYILALTSASQTEPKTFSGGEVILNSLKPIIRISSSCTNIQIK